MVSLHGMLTICTNHLGGNFVHEHKNHKIRRGSLQCRRILGGRNLVRVRNVVVAAIFDFMTVEDWDSRNLFGKFQHGAFASKLCAQRKRLHCRL